MSIIYIETVGHGTPFKVGDVITVNGFVATWRRPHLVAA